MVATKTQGSQLYIIDPTATGGPELVKVSCATSLSGLSNPREQIETTCLESEAREYVGGLSTPSQLTVTVNFDPTNDSHYKLYQLWRENSENFKLSIGFGGSADNDPTVDSDGEFSYPTDRTFIEFEGYVVDVPLDAQLNSVWTAGIPIQISGSYTIFPKTT